MRGTSGVEPDRHTRWVPRVRVTDLEPGERFRLLAAWRNDDGGTINQSEKLVALEVVSDGIWVRIRLEDARTVSLDADDTIVVEDR